MQKYAYLSKYPVIEQYNVMMGAICGFLDQTVAMGQITGYTVKFVERSTIIELSFPQSKATIKVYFRNSVFRLDAVTKEGGKVNQQDFNITNFDQLLMADIFSQKVYPAAREIAKNSMFKVMGSTVNQDNDDTIEKLEKSVRDLEEMNKTLEKNQEVYDQMIKDLKDENKDLQKKLKSKAKKSISKPVLGDGED